MSLFHGPEPTAEQRAAWAAFDAHVTAVVDRQVQAIEQACWDALQHGCGVLVIRDPSEPGEMLVGAVSFLKAGCMVEAPSVDAVIEWIKRGCP